MITNYEKAKNKLLTFTLDGECQSFFEKNNYPMELGYCKLITGQLKDAKEIFKQIASIEQRAHWGCILSTLLLNELTPHPTYFEIRNYLEVDLNLLINYHKGDYVEEILNYTDIFATINPESYKYVGRVLFKNNLNPWAKFFLERAKNHLYQDPELHIIIAELNLAESDFAKAKQATDTCLSILPNYFPALQLKQKLNNI